MTRASMFLVGMRGVGKTACGRLLAARVGARFVDADEEVARRAGCPVETIFTRDGEAAFRSREREVMLDVVEAEGVVVATGGGCVLDGDVRARLAASGRAVWLVAAPSVLAHRVRGTGRPSLTGAPADEELASVLASRAPLYRACAAFVVDTAGLPEAAVVDALEGAWRAWDAS